MYIVIYIDYRNTICALEFYIVYYIESDVYIDIVVSI